MGGGFLKDMDVIKAEGCEKDGKQFVIFTVSKPRKASEVLDSIKNYNEDAEEKMNLISFQDGPEVAVFDRGNCFRSHPISKIIQSAVAEEESWVWSVVVDSDGKKKRAVNELESDLVETSIRPATTKRMASRPVEVIIVPCIIGRFIFHFALLGFDFFDVLSVIQTGANVDQSSTEDLKKKNCGIKKRKSVSLFQKENMGGNAGFGITKDVVVMLVKEIARSKDETIQSKNHMIELLMSRKCNSCQAGQAAE